MPLDALTPVALADPLYDYHSRFGRTYHLIGTEDPGAHLRCVMRRATDISISESLVRGGLSEDEVYASKHFQWLASIGDDMASIECLGRPVYDSRLYSYRERELGFAEADNYKLFMTRLPDPGYCHHLCLHHAAFVVRPGKIKSTLALAAKRLDKLIRKFNLDRDDELIVDMPARHLVAYATDDERRVGDRASGQLIAIHIHLAARAHDEITFDDFRRFVGQFKCDRNGIHPWDVTDIACPRGETPVQFAVRMAKYLHLCASRLSGDMRKTDDYDRILATIYKEIHSVALVTSHGEYKSWKSRPLSPKEYEGHISPPKPQRPFTRSELVSFAAAEEIDGIRDGPYARQLAAMDTKRQAPSIAAVPEAPELPCRVVAFTTSAVWTGTHEPALKIRGPSTAIAAIRRALSDRGIDLDAIVSAAHRRMEGVDPGYWDRPRAHLPPLPGQQDVTVTLVDPPPDLWLPDDPGPMAPETPSLPEPPPGPPLAPISRREPVCKPGFVPGINGDMSINRVQYGPEGPPEEDLRRALECELPEVREWAAEQLRARVE